MNALADDFCKGATQKVDSIIAENPDSSLDELLESRKINSDQKALAQKKPLLQASLAQLEEQIAQYKQFDDDYQKRILSERNTLETAHKEELESVKETVAAETATKAKDDAKETLLILSKFLRAAAAKRQAGDETSTENRAFEGVLLLIYGGETDAVEAMERLVSGADEKVQTVDGILSDFTCKNSASTSASFSLCNMHEKGFLLILHFQKRRRAGSGTIFGLCSICRRRGLGGGSRSG